MSLVIATSVALRWFVEAAGSDAAIALLGSDEPLVAPDLVVAEITNAAWKLVRAGEINEEHGRRIAAAVPSSFAALVGSPLLASRAYELARDLDHPVYDCLYLALAERDATRVITADKRLLKRLSGSKWEHLATAL